MEKLWEIYHVYTHKSNVDKERHDIFWFVQARDIRNRPFNGVNDDEPKKLGTYFQVNKPIGIGMPKLQTF